MSWLATSSPGLLDTGFLSMWPLSSTVSSPQVLTQGKILARAATFRDYWCWGWGGCPCSGDLHALGLESIEQVRIYSASSCMVR